MISRGDIRWFRFASPDKRLVGIGIEHAPDLSIADVARKALCSFATAWQPAQDYRLMRAAGLDGAKG